MARGSLAVIIAISLLGNAFCLPYNVIRPTRDVSDNELSNANEAEQPSSSPPVYTPDPYDDDDDDDDDDDFPEPTNTSSSGGGSNIFSLLKFASALFPSSAGTNAQIRKIVLDIIRYSPRLNVTVRSRRSNKFLSQNKFKKDSPTPQLERQEVIELNSGESSERESSSSSDSGEDNEIVEGSENNNDSDENNAAEESGETNSGSSSSEQNSNSSDDSDESDYDSDEPPGGDGQGGGILGLLAGISGGDNGESDLATLLQVVTGIVLNLSGDGLDLNSLIASGVGLFAGLLSEGEENPGAILASYLLTSLDTITGGGADKNGAFFGRFVSRLIKGISAVGDSEDSSREKSDENEMTMTDSFRFFASLIMGLLGDMSKGSSGGSSS